MCVSIDLLGPEEMILSFAEWLSKRFVDTYKVFHDLFYVR